MITVPNFGWPRLLVSALLVSAVLLPPQLRAESAAFSQGPKIDAFVQRMVGKHGFDEVALRKTLSAAERRQDIIDLMTRPAEGKPWNFYRRIFITQERVRKGAEFWRENADAIEAASRKFGVNPEIIVAIIGVETMYGGNMGRHRVLDALATLAFAYPPRSKFFTSELEHFLLLAREEKVAVDSIKGSYAGAMGFGQFIPSSYRHYAVDGDGDGQRDLMGNTRDAIFSVANYFARHGWKSGQPVAERLTTGSDKGFGKPTMGLKPDRTVAEIEAKGAVIDKISDGKAKVSLMRLKTDTGVPEYWVGFRNFYVITRYNHSHKYAMAAYQLSKQINNRYQALVKDSQPTAVRSRTAGHS